MRAKVWLFDLDNTLHDASLASYAGINQGMNEYIVQTLGVSAGEASALRQRYWLRYGATLLGLVRHHGVRAEHFLHHAHRLPGMEALVRTHAHDIAALTRLRGRRCILTNAPADYTRRVLETLGIQSLFDAVFSIEDMRMFGHWRPKPDARMLRRMTVRLRVHPRDCVLVEDTLEHQKAARSVGLRTVWMQRWLREPAARQRHGEPRRHRPVYVDRRVRALRQLTR